MPKSWSTVFEEVKDRYKYFNLGCVEEREFYKCVTCCDILVEPHQYACGCRCCQSCINQGIMLCPGCKNYREPTFFYTFYDKAMDKELSQLNVSCFYGPCIHRSALRDLENHLMVCEYKIVTKYKENHRKLDIRCVYCGIELPRETFDQTHRNIVHNRVALCDKWKMVCPFKCSLNTHDNIKDHLNNCPNIPSEGSTKDIRLVRLNEIRTELAAMNQEVKNLKKEFECYEFMQAIMDRVNTYMVFLKDIVDSNQIVSNFGSRSYTFTNILSKIQNVKDGSISMIEETIDNTSINGLDFIFLLSLAKFQSYLTISVEIRRRFFNDLFRNRKKIINIKWPSCEEPYLIKDLFLCTDDINELGRSYLLHKITIGMVELSKHCNDNGDLLIEVEILDEVFQESPSEVE